MPGKFRLLTLKKCFFDVLRWFLSKKGTKLRTKCFKNSAEVRKIPNIG